MKAKDLTKWLAAMIAVASLAACGDSSPNRAVAEDPVAMVDAAGKVALGDVAGARVFADYDGDEEWDLEEPFTFTDSQGDFVLSFPAGDYNMVTSGGIDQLTGEPAGTLKAPADATNITYLTTMVVEVPGFKDALEQIAPGVSYDSDVTAELDADFIKITKIVESTVRTFQDLGVTDQDAILDVVATVAEKIVENAPAGGAAVTDVNALLSVSIQESAEEVVAELAANTEDNIDFDVDAGDITALGTALSGIADGVILAIDDNTSEDGTVVEEVVQTSIDDVPTTVDSALVKNVTMSVSGINAGGTDYTSDAFDSITVAEDENSVAVTLAATNDYTTEKAYSDVAVTLSVTDENGRMASFKVKGLSATAAAATVEGDDEAVDLTMDDSAATLEFEAVNAAGDITISLSEALASPIDGLTFDVNVASFDLGAIEAALATQLGTDVIDVADISKLGSYSLVVTVENAPAQAVAGTVEVTAAN